MDLTHLGKWASHDKAFFAQKLEESGIHEYVVLKTCNRIEIYIAVSEVQSAKPCLTSIISDMQTTGAYILEDQDSITHIMRVCAGIESMILGEQEIQKQVKDSLADAQAAGTASKALNYIFMKALSTAKKARASTSLSTSAFSIPKAASAIIAHTKGISSVCIVGTGHMASRVLKELSDAGLSITLCGRNSAKLKALSNGHDINTINLVDFNPSNFDAIITAVSSPEPILRIPYAEKPLLTIDLGNPRNVSSNGKSTYIDLMSVKNYAHVNAKLSSEDNRIISRIMGSSSDCVVRYLNLMEADEIIASLYKSAEVADMVQCGKALKLIGYEHSATVDMMAKSISNAILSGPVQNIKRIIKDGDATKIETLREIFGVDKKR
jgi:glutamyl-tRNA reductase